MSMSRVPCSLTQRVDAPAITEVRPAINKLKNGRAASAAMGSLLNSLNAHWNLSASRYTVPSYLFGLQV